MNWKLELEPDKELTDISNMYNPIIRGWVNYYGKFYKSEMYKVLRHMNESIIQ